MTTIYPTLAELRGSIMFMQPTPEYCNADGTTGAYRTAVYVDNDKYVVFCKHTLTRVFYRATEMPPELAVNLAIAAAQRDVPLYGWRASPALCVTALISRDAEYEKNCWIAPNLYVVLLSADTHERLLEGYIGDQWRVENDPGSTGESTSKEVIDGA